MYFSWATVFTGGSPMGQVHCQRPGPVYEHWTPIGHPLSTSHWPPSGDDISCLAARRFLQQKSRDEVGLELFAGKFLLLVLPLQDINHQVAHLYLIRRLRNSLTIWASGKFSLFKILSLLMIVFRLTCPLLSSSMTGIEAPWIPSNST